jgi:hypothetical protein
MKTLMVDTYWTFLESNRGICREACFFKFVLKFQKLFLTENFKYFLQMALHSFGSF